MAHFSSVIKTYGAGRYSQWATPFAIFSSSGKGKLSDMGFFIPPKMELNPLVPGQFFF
jgi:hypothetical protein